MSTSIPCEKKSSTHAANIRTRIFGRLSIGGFALALVLALAIVQPAAADSNPELYYSYSCDCSGIDYPLSWEKCDCCQPGEDCPIFENGHVVGTNPDFQTGDNGTEPYSGVLDPSQKLQLTIQCATGKVTGVKLHTDKIKCSHSQKTKGTKIYNCHNKSDKSHHSWELKSYQCPQDDS